MLCFYFSGRNQLLISLLFLFFIVYFCDIWLILISEFLYLLVWIFHFNAFILLPYYGVDQYSSCQNPLLLSLLSVFYHACFDDYVFILSCIKLSKFDTVILHS